jgi:RNA polymerase primary sigma factor
MRQLKINKLITNRDSQSVDKYLADISKEGMITAEEEAILAQKIRDGDQRALEKLVISNLRFVVSVAKQYQNQGLTLSDLINEGNVGLIKAAGRFDETRGFKFISYAVWWIRQSIAQAIAVNSRMVRLPLNKVSAMNKIRKAGARLEQVFEREPSIEEIAVALDMREDEIRVTMEASGRHISTDSSLSGTEDMTLIDVLENKESPRPDGILMAASLSTEIKRALSNLSPRESETIILFYGIGLEHPLTLDEIGYKQGITRERVRQIKEKAIRRLRVSSRSKLLKAYLG